MSKSRHRAWCFTIYNDLENKEKRIQEIKDKFEYLIYGRETCPETKKKHLQGFCYFQNGKSMSATKKLFKDNAMHLEPTKGSIAQNIKYCSKEGNFFFFGVPPNQGKRNDIEVSREALENGANIRDIITSSKNNQVIQYSLKWLTYLEKKRTWKPKVIWLYGPTSTGKSHKAHAMFPNAYEHAGSNIKWWDGYDAHEDVIIDEMRTGFCEMRDILRLLDKYPLRVEIKGGYRQFLAKNIIITSHKSPQEIFGRYNENIDQLIRRIDKIEHMTTRYEK